MKKIFSFGLFFLITFTAFANETITIAATKTPQAQILNFIKPTLQAQGYDLQIIEYVSYTEKNRTIIRTANNDIALTPNELVFTKQADANFFQHTPYLEYYNKKHNTNLVPLVKVFFTPMGLYGNGKTLTTFAKTKDLNDIPSDAAIGIPADPVNRARALGLLQSIGLIKLSDAAKYPSINDITSNPHNVDIVEVDAGALAPMLQKKQLDLAFIGTSMALQAGLSMSKDAILLEGQNNIYTNIVAVRPSEVDEPKMKALAKALNIPEVKNYVEKKYNGIVIPSF